MTSLPETIEKAKRLVEAVEHHHAVAGFMAACSDVSPTAFDFARALVQLAEQAQWRDISAAPRDGTPILACDAGNVLVVQWMTYPNRDASGGWWDSFQESEWNPTHWMPLPKGPAT